MVDSRYGAFAIEREEGQRLAKIFGALDTFPVHLSALEKIAGRSLAANFSSESKSAGFEHDGRGPIGPNVGGRPIDHSAKDAPMLFELRSQYYPRYDDERRFRNRPPFATDDPLIDRIEISDLYASGPAPTGNGLRRFDNLVYLDSGEFWRMKSMPEGKRQKHQGFLSIAEKEANQRRLGERWKFKLSVERGAYYDVAEVEHGLAPILELIEALKSKKDFAPVLTAWKQKYAKYEDTSSYDFGLISHNPRYFHTKFTDGPYKGDFLVKEGRTSSFYVNTYVNTGAASKARVTIPTFFAALGVTRAKVTADIPSPAPFRKPSDAIVYYNRVKVEKGNWLLSMSGFYAADNGKIVTDLDLAKFMPGSISLSYHETAK